MSDHVLEVIRTRRVVRRMSDRPVERADLEQVLDAGRWAPAGGNQRVIRFVAVQDPGTLRLLRMVSPGMLQRPGAVIVLCIDHDLVRANGFSAADRTPFIDLGTTMQTMMLAAHAIGLGSGPVTSFAREAVRPIMGLPRNLSPEVMVCLGHRGEGEQLPMHREGRGSLSWKDLTMWERFEAQPT